MKVLFISHDAFRAGAQLLLLEFMQWCKQHTSLQMELLLVKGGDLIADFESVCTTHHWAEPSLVSRRHKPLTWWKKKQVLQKLQQAQFDLIYANTGVNGAVLRQLAPLKAPVISHIHELSFWLDRAGNKNWTDTLQHTHAYITAAQAVKDEVVRRGAPAEKVTVIYEHTRQPKPSSKADTLRQRLQLPANALIIGSCGGEIWRKGKDLFVPLAEATLALYQGTQPLHFVWIGGKSDVAIDQQWQTSPAKAHIHFVTHLPNAADYFGEFDVFAMLSRDDPFPTVNLEAGIRSVPVVVFANSGGSPELVAQWPDQIVPFEDVQAYAARLSHLLQNESERKDIGTELAAHIAANFLTDKIAKELYAQMEHVLTTFHKTNQPIS